MAVAIRSEAEVAELVLRHAKLVDYMVNRYLKRYFVGSMEREDLLTVVVEDRGRAVRLTT